MIVKNEAEMIEFGENFARENRDKIQVIELIGDVGAGKTTFMKGFAKGLGVSETITSPSFTISKEYEFPGGVLVHYDFYRLEEAGLMADDLKEKITEGAVVAVEWGEDVKGILPKNRTKIEIKLKENGEREVKW